MKKARVLSAVAVLLSVLGAFQIISSIQYMAAQPNAALEVEREVKQVSKQLEQLGSDRRFPSERMQHIRDRVQESIQASRQFVTSPIPVVAGLFTLVLGISSLVAGVGVMLRRRFARFLAILQAILAMAFDLWSEWGLRPGPTATMQQELQRVLTDTPQLLAPAGQPFLKAYSGVDWLGIAFAITWDGFLLWYFLRAAVKAQFQRPA